MQRFLLVCGAGGLGSGARYLVSQWANTKLGEAMWGTLLVNLIGSFLIAVVFALLAKEVISEQIALTLATGFMGGFTTYSAFNYQTTTLASSGQHGRAAVNIAITLGGCLVAGLAGAWLARRIA